MAGEGSIRFIAKMRDELIVCLLDTGSEVSLINERLMRNLEEGVDYTFIRDSDLMGLKGSIPSMGRVKIKAKVGLQLTKDLRNIGFEACIVKDNQGKESWDFLLGADLQTDLGRTTIRMGENMKPLVLIQPTSKTNGMLRNLDGSEAEDVVLDTLPALS